MYDVTHPGGWKYGVSEQSESLEFIRVFDCSGLLLSSMAQRQFQTFQDVPRFSSIG